MARIHVLGAGIVGVWQALTLRRRGHLVSLSDPAGIPSKASASRLAGAMLAPFCEAEAGHEVIRELGVASLDLWRAAYRNAVMAGSLVVASARDRADLSRFAAVTSGYRWLDATSIEAMEPDLGGRFAAGLFYEGEGHADPRMALENLCQDAAAEGVVFGPESKPEAEWVLDCRGIAAKDQLKSLRGVRGERCIIQCSGVALTRPVRLLHPRMSFYIVPWDAGRFMIGATVIESEDAGPCTLRSALELLGGAYALLPALGEARVLDIAASVRPAFPDNLPKIIVRGRHIFVNGLFRHGFLLSPILAQLTADYIDEGLMRDGVVVEDRGEW